MWVCHLYFQALKYNRTWIQVLAARSAEEEPQQEELEPRTIVILGSLMVP